MAEGDLGNPLFMKEGKYLVLVGSPPGYIDDESSIGSGWVKIALVLTTRS